MNDQWKLDGDCSECRRQKYCTKSCKANTKRHNRLMSEAMARTTLGKAMSILRDGE